MVETHLCPVETVFSYLILFLQAETVTEIIRSPFFGGKTLFPLAERDFLSNKNCFLFLFRASYLQVKPATETS